MAHQPRKLTNRLVVGIPVALLVLPAFIFGSTWGEELNHVWYSIGAAPSQSEVLPFAANNFGKVVIFGNPVYDFSIATGARLPLQTGASGTIFVLLRHVFSTELVAMFSMLAIAVPALFVFNHTLTTLNIFNAWIRTAILSAYVSIPAYYLTEFDWYSISTGYFAMATLMCVIVLLLDSPHGTDARTSSGTALLVASIVLIFAFPSSYISYLHVSIVAIIAALIAGRRRLFRSVRLNSVHVLLLVPVLAVSIGTLCLTAIDLRVAGSMQEDLIRNTNQTTLFSPLKSWASAKHLVLQTVTGDWRGVIGALSSGTVLKYAAANIPVTLFFSTVAMFGVLSLTFRGRLLRTIRVRSIDVFLLLSIFGGILAMWWTPLPRELDVSDRNFYGHLTTVSSLLLVGRFCGRPPSMLQRGGIGIRARQTLWYAVVIAFVVNSLLLVPTALRATIENRKLLIAPNALTATLIPSNEVSHAAGVLDRLQPGQRVMSFTEAFDAQKYFQSSFGQFITFNDLTARGLPTINAYPKIRDASNISVSNKFSSSLAPSSLQIETSTHCPFGAVRFLAVTTLVLSAQQTHNCRYELSQERVLRTFIVGTRDGIVMFAHVFGDHPSYWVRSASRNEARCPVIEQECWMRLGWRADQISRVRLQVNDPSPSRAPVDVIVSSVPRRDELLVLPMTYDRQLRVTAESRGGSELLPVQSVNGFTAVQPRPSDVPTTLSVTVSPDRRMFTYALLPYLWIIGLVLSFALWWIKRREILPTKMS